MKPFPEHGLCFACGTQNPHGIGIQWFVRDDGALTGTISLSLYQQGPPGHAHGGATAALLDDAMGLSVWAAGHQVAAVNLTVDYRKPVPLGQPITITGWMTSQQERVIHAAGTISLPDGTVAVEGRGIYVEAPQLFAGAGGFDSAAS